MIKQMIIFLAAIIAAGCVRDTPPLQLTTNHPANPNAATAPPAVMSNTLAIKSAPSTAPASASTTTPQEGAHEHHHH
jgi:hypothetical protein